MRHIKWPPVLHRPHPDGDVRVRIDPTIIRPKAEGKTLLLKALAR